MPLSRSVPMLKTPSTHKEFTARNRNRNYAHAVGDIDGKHATIKTHVVNLELTITIMRDYFALCCRC